MDQPVRLPRVRCSLQWMMVVIILVALLLAAIHSIRLIERDAREKAVDNEWSSHPNGGPI